MKLFYGGLLLGGKEMLQKERNLGSQKEQNESFSVPGIPGWLSGISKNWTGLEDV